MRFNSHCLSCFLPLLVIFFASFTNAAEVKLSSSGICHDESSSFYTRTKNFTPFTTMNSCIEAGGRVPRSYKPTNDNQSLVREKSNRFKSSENEHKYDRKSYDHWIDTDRDCQNVRHELLIATSTKPVKFTNYRKCTVKSGEWYDLYTDKTYTLASDLDIDHVVPLFYSFTHGGSNWTNERKRVFANDPENLLAVRDIDNQTKSAQGPSTWMPSHQAYRCDYLSHFMRVMDKYDLTLHPGEKRIITRMQKACGQ